MSVTVAHRPHIHLPYKSIAIFLVAAAVAAGALVIVNQPWEEQSATTTTTTATATGAVAAPAQEPWSMLRAHPELIPDAGTGAAQTEAVTRHNLVIGTVLSGQQAYVSQAPARSFAPGEVENAHPLNLIAGSKR